MQQAQTGKIPPLMGIQTNPTLPQPPGQMPSSTSHVAAPPISNPVSTVPPVGTPQPAASGATNSPRHPVTGGKGPQPNAPSGASIQRASETGGKQMRGKEDSDDKGYVTMDMLCV